jgi:hypothetical protein
MFPSNFAQLIDFSRRPRPRRASAAITTPANAAPVTIRRAAAADEPALARLAALDERELPCGERLVALLAGRPVAAVEVRSGRTIADPFVPTQHVVELLGLRAAQVQR